MFVLLLAPVVVLVAVTHRTLQIYAPTNILIARARSSRPCLNMVTTLVGLATVMLLCARLLTIMIATGAPAWLNLVLLVLLWDAIKLMSAAGLLVLRIAAPRRAAVRHAS